VISGNGEYVAYAVQWMRNIRIRQDRMSTGATISVNCSAYSCNQPSLNADGRYIALVVLITQPGLSRQRIEVQDAQTGATQTIANLGHTVPSRPSISGDGRYVAYQDGETQDVFVRDWTGGTVSGPIEGPSAKASLVQLSDDGSKVVYLSGPDTYVHDVASGAAQLVPNVRGVAIDPTGRYLLYTPNDPSGPSLTLRDLQTGTDEIVSDQPASAGTDAVSAGGRDVVYQSAADDIVPGDTNGKSDLFVRHFS
jgi:Tol biopolymer transport system component